MLNYAVYLQITNKLSQLSSLTKSLVNPGSFYFATIEYLAEFQKLADMHNLFVSSDIATTQNKLITFNPKKEKASGIVRQNLRKEQDAFAANSLEELQKLIKAFLEKDTAIFEECSSVCRQVVSRALVKGFEEQIFSSINRVETIISILKNDSELAPYYSHIIGLVGIYNAMAILDSVLPQLKL